MSGALRGALATAGKVLGGVFIAGGVVAAIKDVANAASEHNLAFAVLDKTLKNAGVSVKGFGTSIEAVLEKEGRLKGFSDEQLANSMTRLVSVTHNAKQAFHDLQLAEDLARARGIDVSLAALAISKAEQGSTQALQRYGIVVPKVSAATDALRGRYRDATAAGVKFSGSLKDQYVAALNHAKATDAAARRTESLRIITDRFGGTAAVYAKTAPQFSRLAQAIHLAEVNIGEGILPTLNKATVGLTHFFDKVADSQRVRGEAQQFARRISDGFAEIGRVAALAAPPLIAIAKAALDVAHALPIGLILTSVVAFKALGLAAGVVSGIQKRLVAITTAGRTALVTETAAADANTTSWSAMLGVKTKAAEADAADTGSLAALTAALDANTLALGGNVAAARLSSVEMAQLSLATDAAAADIGAVGTAATVETGTLAAFGAGLTGIIGGLPLLGVGLAVAATGFVYLATRESALSRQTRETATALGILDDALQHTADLRHQIAAQKDVIGQDKLAVQSARLSLQQASNGVTATPGTLLFKQQSLAVKQASSDLHRALKQLGDDQRHLGVLTEQTTRSQGNQTKGLKESLTEVEKTAAAIRDQIAPAYNIAGQQATKAQRSFIEANLIGPKVIAGFIDKLGQLADKLKGQHKFIEAGDVELLQQFVDHVKRLPTRREVKVILGIKDTTVTLNDLLTKILPAAMGQAADLLRQGGSDAGKAFAQGLDSSLGGAGGSIGTILGVQIEGPLGMLLDSVRKKRARAAAKAAAEDTKDSTDAIDKALDKSIEATKKKLRDLGRTSGQEISSLKTDLSDLNTQLKDAIVQEAIDINDAVNSAKQNLNSIGSTIAGQIGSVLDEPIRKAQAAIAALQNKQSLESLRRSVFLPGGRELAKDPTQAIKQLETLQRQGGPNQFAIKNFLLQYRTALLTTRQDTVNATKEAATRTVSDLTDALSSHRITPKQFQAGILRLLQRDHVSFALAGKVLGRAFEDGFRAEVGGLLDQAKVIFNGPQRPGAGLAPTIVRPLTTLITDQREIHRLQREIGNKQIELQKRVAKASETTAKLTGQLLAQEKLRSRDKAPGKNAKGAAVFAGTVK